MKIRKSILARAERVEEIMRGVERRCKENGYDAPHLTESGFIEYVIPEDKSNSWGLDSNGLKQYMSLTVTQTI